MAHDSIHTAAAFQSISHLVYTVHDYMPLNVNTVACCLSMLYCRHKGYTYELKETPNRGFIFEPSSKDVRNDDILSALLRCISSSSFPYNLHRFQEELDSVKEEVYTEYYSQIIDHFFATVSTIVGNTNDIYYIQPLEVTALVTYFLRKKGVTKVYNPFAGLCSYPIALGNGYSFYAQELNTTTWAFAKVRLDAYGLDPSVISLGNSVREWDDHGADSIVASVPFGMTFRVEERKELGFHWQNYDDYFFYKAIGIGQDSIHFPKKCIATIVPKAFCYRNSSKTIREYLCTSRCIDTIIELPEGIFPGTSVATSIIILSEEDQRESLRFFDATSFFIAYKSKNGIGMDNVDRIIAELDKDKSDYIKHVKFADVAEQNFILCGDNYLPDDYNCSPGKEVVRLGDIAWTIPNLPALALHDTDSFILDESGFSNNVLDIIHPNERCLSTTRTTDGYYQTGPCLIFAQKEGEVKVFNYRDNKPIIMKMRYLPLHIKEGISPEYLAMTLLKDPIFCRQFKQRSGMSLIQSVFLNRNIIIDVPSQQEQQLHLAEQKEKDLMDKTRAAEDARYHISKAGSDIAHMLGATFKKQNEIISQFRFIEPGSDKYQSYVTSLIDTAQYVNRVITSVGKDLAKAKITLRKTDISSEIEDYIRAWGNFNGTADFTLIIQDMTNHDVTVKMDTLLFRILMDTLIDNAWRHGFDQGNYQAQDGNMIAVRLSPVLVDEKQYLRLSLMNNGHPLDNQYSVRDYIERGNFKGDSGRTGLGGNHVYTITKRHNGLFALNSEQDWSFVADVLLPVETPGQTPFNTEYDGEYV